MHFLYIRQRRRVRLRRSPFECNWLHFVQVAGIIVPRADQRARKILSSLAGSSKGTASNSSRSQPPRSTDVGWTTICFCEEAWHCARAGHRPRRRPHFCTRRRRPPPCQAGRCGAIRPTCKTSRLRRAGKTRWGSTTTRVAATTLSHSSSLSG